MDMTSTDLSPVILSDVITFATASQYPGEAMSNLLRMSLLSFMENLGYQWCQLVPADRVPRCWAVSHSPILLKFNWLDATHLKCCCFFILFLNNKMWWTFPGFGSLNKNYTWFKFDQSLSHCLTGTTGLFRLVLTNPVLSPCFCLIFI